MTLPRLLVIMGSGETAPTMKIRTVESFERIEASGVSTNPVMLDTPFGFQENAPILAATTTRVLQRLGEPGRRRRRPGPDRHR